MVTDVCNLDMLDTYFTGKSCTIRLAKSSAALADSDVLATHTVAVGGGYADITLTNPVVASVSGIPTVTWDAVTWMFTGVLTSGTAVDMYQIISGTDLLCEGMLPLEVTPGDGIEVEVTPTFKLGNGTPT